MSVASPEDSDLAWTVLAYDTVTDRPLLDLPVRPSQLGWALNGPGTMDQLTLPMSALGENSRQEIVDATIPWRTSVYVDLDGILVFGGLITRRGYDSASRTLSLPVSGWAEYFTKNIITETLAWKQVDQLQIVRDIFLACRGLPGFPKLVVDQTQMSGVLRDRTYPATDLKRVLDAVQDMSDNLGGFDWRIDVRWNQGVPERVLQLGYPQLGAPLSQSNLAIDYTRHVDGSRTGNCETYDFPEDATRLRTETWGLAETDTGVTNLAVARSTAAIAAGYPLLMEILEGHDSVMNVSTLHGYTNLETQARSVPEVAAQFVVNHAADTLVTTWKVGDVALATITDDRFPSPDGINPGLVRALRTTAATLDIASNKLTITCDPYPERAL